MDLDRAIISSLPFQPPYKLELQLAPLYSGGNRGTPPQANTDQDSRRQTGCLWPGGNGSLELPHNLTHSRSRIQPPLALCLASTLLQPIATSSGQDLVLMRPVLYRAFGTMRCTISTQVNYTAQVCSQTEARLKVRSWGVGGSRWALQGRAADVAEVILLAMCQ